MNDLVREFLKANPAYHAVLKHMSEFEGDIRSLDKFRKFKKRKNRKAKVTSKLSFEINVDKDEMVNRSVSETMSKNSIKTKTVRKKKTVKKEMKKKLSSKFISHIVELGFDAKDASRLYENKDDWLGMTRDGRILCTEQQCKFSTPLSSDCLFEHCRTVHDWRDYPCSHDNCAFVAYSSTSFKKHLSKFHSPYKTRSGNFYSCPRANCLAAFAIQSKLIRHEKIHANEVSRCVFCPYVSTQQLAISLHQRMHFNTRDYACDVCEKAFTTRGMLNVHVKLHDANEARTQCPLCDRVGSRRRVQSHLRDKHRVTGVKWSEKKNQYNVPTQIENKS